jgi:hypothetical protein
LSSFSTRQLFADVNSVDAEWLNTLDAGAKILTVAMLFSFLAGFWRQNYKEALSVISQPTLVVVGDTASSISQVGKEETPEQRLADYLSCLPKGRGIKFQAVMFYPTNQRPNSLPRSHHL